MEVLKIEGEARGFQPSQGTLRMLMNDKIMFDRYYCINSSNHWENEENIGALYFITITFSYLSTLFKTMHDSGPVQTLIILHVLCVAPGNKHNSRASTARAHDNSLINTRLLFSLIHGN